MSWPVGRSLSSEHRAKALAGSRKAAIARRSGEDGWGARQSAILKEKWKDPEYRKKRTIAFKEITSKPEFWDAVRRASKSPEKRAKISKALTGLKRPYRPKSLEHRSRIASALKGKPKSLGHRSKLGKYIRTPEALLRQAEGRIRYWRQNPRPITNLELALYRLLEYANFEYQKEVPFGPYIVDTYLPDYGIAFEADGDFWHQYGPRIIHDKRRDEYLKGHLKAVIHLRDSDLSPWVGGKIAAVT